MTDFFPPVLEQSAFMEGYLSGLSFERRQNFRFLYEAFRLLITEDIRIEKSVRELFGEPPVVLREKDILMRHIARAVGLCKTRDNDCKRQTIRTIKALKCEHSLPLMQIEQCVEFHSRHLQHNDPGGYFQFFGCVGLLCTEAVAWGMQRYFLNIIKEAEDAIHSYKSSFPGYGTLCVYAEKHFRNS